MEILKQNIGVDISKDTFVSTITILFKNLSIEHLKTKEFKNTKKGLESFFEWANKNKKEGIPLHFTMEATGVYYELLAYYLFEQRQIVHVLLPNKAKKYMESLNTKSKTDKIDSQLLARMGLERNLEQFSLSSKIYRSMRKLTRERMQLVEEKTMIKNQLHAEQNSVDSLEATIDRMKERIKFIEQQIKIIETELKQLIKEDEFVSDKVSKLETIPGIGFITTATIIAETQGFANITNIKQLASYAGYDIRLRESGTLKGKTRISKKGNSFIRKTMFMPSLTTIKYSKTYKQFYDRIEKKKNNGLVASTAVQRKLLGLMFTLWKNDTIFDDNYQSKAA